MVGGDKNYTRKWILFILPLDDFKGLGLKQGLYPEKRIIEDKNTWIPHKSKSNVLSFFTQ